MVRPKKTPDTPKAMPPTNGAAAEVIKKPHPLPRPAELQQMIETAAYFKAEKDGFRMNPGLYWKEAEAEIRSRFR
jgi:hypothetical protein